MFGRKVHETRRVFGVQPELVETYVERPEVDERFLYALKSQRQIVVYGSSKQGKSALLQKHLAEGKTLTVECSPKSTATDIYRSILRQSNVTYTEADEITSGIEAQARLSVSARIKVLITGEAEARADMLAKGSESTKRIERYVEYNLDLAQDVSEILRQYKVNKFIVLENFHYLDLDVQKQLAFDLRTFQDYQITFIVLGIWREANRLVQFNGDLQDRLAEIPVEPWEPKHFESIVNAGEDMLKVDLSAVFKDVIASAYDSVGVFQELCREACLAAGVERTQKQTVALTDEHLSRAISKKADEYAMRHQRNFESFVDIAKKISSQTGQPSLALPYYFIIILLEGNLDDIEQGLHRRDLQESIKARHHRPDDVRASDMTNFLNGLTQYQVKRSISPPFVDYDYGSRRVKIIDSTLYFFLRHADRKQILEELPSPIET